MEYISDLIIIEIFTVDIYEKFIGVNVLLLSMKNVELARKLRLMKEA